MAKHRMPDDEPQPATGDSGATYWSVAEGDWPEVRPTLPAEMIDLLAPPIVVGVARVVATSRMTPPADAGVPARSPGPARLATAGGRLAPGGATTVRLAAGVTSRPPTPRLVAGPAPAATAPPDATTLRRGPCSTGGDNKGPFLAPQSKIGPSSRVRFSS